jgi:cold shock protein
MSERDSGTVIHWSTDRKYGFIRPHHGERDVFFHITGCEMPEGETPRIGDKVSYIVEADRRPGREAKLCAKDVQFVAEENKLPAGLFMRADDAASHE